MATLKVSLPKVRKGFQTVFLKVEFSFRLKEMMSFEILKKRAFQHNRSYRIVIPAFSLTSDLRGPIL